MREPTKQEMEAITAGLAAWGYETPSVALDGNIVYAIDREVLNLPPEVLSSAQPTRPIARLEDGFELLLQGAARGADTNHRLGTVRVEEKVSHLVLYGRNVLPPAVMDHDQLSIGDACIIVDPRREAVGVGQVVGTFKGELEVVETTDDLGRYLRG